MAKRISLEQSGGSQVSADGSVKLGDGSVSFLELDAEKMGEYFGSEPNGKSFGGVWISEAMSHLPDKALFFRNAELLLEEGGKLVIADWFNNEEVTEAQFEADIRPIEGKMSSFQKVYALFINWLISQMVCYSRRYAVKVAM